MLFCSVPDIVKCRVCWKLIALKRYGRFVSIREYSNIATLGRYSQKVLGLNALHKSIEFKTKTWLSPFMNTSPGCVFGFLFSSQYFFQYIVLLTNVPICMGAILWVCLFFVKFRQEKLLLAFHIPTHTTSLFSTVMCSFYSSPNYELNTQILLHYSL